MARILSNGDVAIGAFNFSDQRRTFSAQLDSLGLGECTGKTLELTDVWTGEKQIVPHSTITVNLDAHQCAVYRASVVDK